MDEEISQNAEHLKSERQTLDSNLKTTKYAKLKSDYKNSVREYWSKGYV